jgi:mannose-6-phosphate isomerase-like protein (cupin superfamily)
MTAASNPTERLFARGPAEGQALWFINNRTIVKATADLTGGAYGLVESWVPAGYSPPLHVHHREDEAFYVVEGKVTMRCGDRTLTGGPGSFFFLPRDVPHTFLVDASGPAHLLTLISPGGGEGFFVAAGRPAEHDGLPPQEPIDVARLRAAGAQFGAEIVGPPMKADS